MLTLPLLLAALTVAPLRPGDHRRQLEVDGVQRSYLVHVPQQSPHDPPPLVLAFHGAGMNGRLMAQWTGLHEKADQAGFVVVYPNGTGIADWILTFNVGQRKTDEVEFVKQMLEDLASVLSFDPKRIYATGYSNGGMLCYLLAAKLPERIAAIAPVAAICTIDPPELPRAVPVIHFHGTKDMWVRWDPQHRKGTSILTIRSVPETIQLWAERNRCPPQPKVTELPNHHEDDTTVRRETYGPGAAGAEVILMAIEGGGHTWPGKKPPVDFLGKSTEEISANDLIWEFFQRYRLP